MVASQLKCMILESIYVFLKMFYHILFSNESSSRVQHKKISIVIICKPSFNSKQKILKTECFLHIIELAIFLETISNMSVDV